MTQITFIITEEKINDLEWEDLEIIERMQEGEFKSSYRIRPLLAKFMVNGDGQTPVPYDDALKVLKKLKVGQIKETMEKFAKAMTDATVPKANATD